MLNPLLHTSVSASTLIVRFLHLLDFPLLGGVRAVVEQDLHDRTWGQREGIEQCKQQHDSPHVLVLAGPDWNGADEVKNYAAQSPISDQIVFLGSIPRDDIVRLYSACEFMAFPSLFEGFGFPLLEALACGARVICSDSTALSELALGYAETFDPYSVEEIAASMEHAIERSFTNEEKERGIEYARSFQWDKTAREVLEVYQECGKGVSVL